MANIAKADAFLFLQPIHMVGGFHLEESELYKDNNSVRWSPMYKSADKSSVIIINRTQDELRAFALWQLCLRTVLRLAL